jgi:hypothetical protein
MPRRFIDLTGQKFGRLYVVGPADEPIDDRPCWRVLCECGKYHTVRGRSLRRGDTRSCGCLRVEHASKKRHLVFWRALRAAGLDIEAGWIGAEFNITGEEPSADEWRKHWAMCCQQASEADVVLLYVGISHAGMVE